ncbi:hypothetical protein FXO38_06053 [Capsicum annuum]|nr:hypothetical protein FXO38_06053 [Capsicum annuum]
MHVFVKGNILKFSIFEFALITSLKYSENVEDFRYSDSSPNRLMQRYFFQSTNEVDKEALVKRFLMKKFDTIEDALQMAILYFIHTFIYSQLKVAPVPFSDFKMVEDGTYELFSWGKVVFSKLLASLRHEFFVEKQFYRLGGIPQVLNVWMFEICSKVETNIVIKQDNHIPRILNWKVIAVRSQYNQFMTEMFSKCICSNLVPTAGKLKQLDLPAMSIASYHPGAPSMRLSTGLTNADSPQKDSDKSVEMKGAKVNQEPSPIKYCEHNDMDAGIEQMDNIVIEEMEPLKTIIPVSVSGMSLTVYKPPLTTLDENCGIFVAVYAEYLSGRLGIPSSGIDVQYHRLRYTILLCKYFSEKMENGYFSENNDPPRLSKSFIPAVKDRVLNID